MEKKNWVKIRWIRFLRTEPYKMFNKASMNQDILLKTLDLLPRWSGPRNFNNIIVTPIYKNMRSITVLKNYGTSISTSKVSKDALFRLLRA